MQRTKEFSPETLESALAGLLLPKIENPDVVRYVQTARNALLATYKIAYAKRFNAELDPNEWPAVVADIFCNAIDTALRDSGRNGVRLAAGVLPPTADDGSRLALRKALNQTK